MFEEYLLLMLQLLPCAPAVSCTLFIVYQGEKGTDSVLAPFSPRQGKPGYETTTESLLTFLPSTSDTRDKIKNKSLWKWAF